ncbi:28S ribosomal protein S22, mitochondrial-like [Mizuhopecten yessoensis]|uniref:28S ribosomal protein S22, mitochondrial n=1 Tax=Mizuhopecten yessoensis TaxID=6573 RepID=A0A210Q2W2_MIZYE|nr:28S ribosomal protein S22, mitochondrial-like [Mizuhopecten yessoensis]OWF43077.1 28S ribosomal protein S22, mitochondrial [Mizuhopecten yessoensis]
MASLDHLKIFRRLFNLRRACLQTRTYAQNSSQGSLSSSETDKSDPQTTLPPSSGGGPTMPHFAQDPLPIFLQRRVQEVLLKISRLNMDDFVRIRKTDHHVKPRYELMSDVELRRMEVKAMERATEMLKMPPFMKAPNLKVEVLSHDPEIAPALTSKWVFVDISSGVHNRDRIIVVRDNDGKLRKAIPDERRRANLLYYPKFGVSIVQPKMFEQDQLEHLLENRLTDIRYILDRACTQFEPDDPNFIRVTSTIYEYVWKNRCFNDLGSTRFFGPMSFYFILKKDITYLLVDMIQHDLLTDAVSLIHLYKHIYKNEKIPTPYGISQNKETQLSTIQRFCKTDSDQKQQNWAEVESAIRSYRLSLTDRATAS